MGKQYTLPVKEAVNVLERAYIPDPKGWRFGSAVLTKKGDIYSSGQYYSDTYSLTLHAEQAALAHAAAHGEHDVVAIAAVSTEDPKGKAFCHPCGMCKQLLYEHAMRSPAPSGAGRSGHDVDVVMANHKGEYIVKKISQLISFPWPPEEYYETKK